MVPPAQPSLAVHSLEEQRVHSLKEQWVHSLKEQRVHSLEDQRVSSDQVSRFELLPDLESQERI
jgi:hypothetical protein